MRHGSFLGLGGPTLSFGMDSSYGQEVDTLLARHGLGMCRAEKLIACGVDHHTCADAYSRDICDFAATRARIAADLDLERRATDEMDDLH
jgi:hypothetical protein